MTIIDLYTGESHIVTAKGDAPEPRVGHTAVTIDSDIYIFGGVGHSIYSKTDVNSEADRP